MGNVCGESLSGISERNPCGNLFGEALLKISGTLETLAAKCMNKTKMSWGIFLENIFWESFRESFAGINLFGESFWGIFLEKSLMRIILGNLCLKSLEGIVWGIFWESFSGIVLENLFGESFWGILLGKIFVENLFVNSFRGIFLEKYILGIFVGNCCGESFGNLFGKSSSKNLCGESLLRIFSFNLFGESFWGIFVENLCAESFWGKNYFSK